MILTHSYAHSLTHLLSHPLVGSCCPKIIRIDRRWVQGLPAPQNKCYEDENDGDTFVVNVKVFGVRFAGSMVQLQQHALV